MIIVIDGPAGAGKSSTARAVARNAGLHLLDTGAFYRMATVLFLREGRDGGRLLKRLETAQMSAVPTSADGLRFLLDGEDVTRELRTPDVSGNVSIVAAMPQVRDQVNRRLRPIAAQGDFIAEGRDLGTVVFPTAELKFWMTANLDERARRRAEELRLAGMDVDEASIRANLAERDFIDSTRDAAPLTRADDAIDVDTSRLSFDEQVEFIMSHYHELQKKNIQP